MEIALHLACALARRGGKAQIAQFLSVSKSVFTEADALHLIHARVSNGPQRFRTLEAGLFLFDLMETRNIQGGQDLTAIRQSACKLLSGSRTIMWVVEALLSSYLTLVNRLLTTDLSFRQAVVTIVSL